MRRILSLIIGILAFTAISQAQVVLWRDYCDGQYDSRQRAVAEVGEVEVAIYFTHDQLAELAGNEVSQLQMAFPTTHPSAMTMWLRSDRNGENLREVEVKTITSKWNTYKIDSPLPLTGEEEGLWVGATWTQKYATNKYLSMAGTTHENGCFYRVDGGEWKSKASEDLGSLCIRMGVTGDNIPQHDLSISRVSASELTYGIGDVIPFSARITNHGADDAVNPIVRCTINGEAVTDLTLTQTITANAYADVTLKVPTASVTKPGTFTFGFEVLWADGQPDTKPANNTDAINIGLVVAKRDLALENVSTNGRLYGLGSTITVTGTIRNNNYMAVQNPKIAYSFNGGEVTKKSVSCKLSQGQSKDFSITIPTKTAITEDGPVTIDLELVWPDDAEDDYAADNKAQLKVAFTSAAPNRRLVCEEGTGTWCGWCVRGIVGLHDMAAKYPDQFIGIAVHNSDAMQHAAYANFLVNMGINGYPGSIINRQRGSVDPSFGNLEKALKAMPQYSEVDVNCEADLSATNFSIRAIVKPLVNIDNANYSVVFVMTEDHISEMQSNYYAGGGSGVMGGYEKLGSSVKVDFLDVARYIWPLNNPESEPAAQLPTTMEAGQSYSVEHKVSPSSVTHKDIDNLNCIAIVIDRETGLVVNAGKFEQRLTGIDTVLAPEAPAVPAYNLAGQRISGNHHGIAIEGGKKVVR